MTINHHDLDVHEQNQSLRRTIHDTKPLLEDTRDAILCFLEVSPDDVFAKIALERVKSALRNLTKAY